MIARPVSGVAAENAALFDMPSPRDARILSRLRNSYNSVRVKIQRATGVTDRALKHSV